MPVSDEQFLLSCLNNIDGKFNFAQIGVECGMSAATGAVQIRLRRLKAKYAKSLTGAPKEKDKGVAPNDSQEEAPDDTPAKVSQGSARQAKKRKVKLETAEEDHW